MTRNPSLVKNPDLDNWLAFTLDGRVRVQIGKVDIGQKISTAVLRIAADELDLEPGRIQIMHPDTIDGPDEGMTSGSNSIEEAGNAVRLAAATARMRLLTLAAAKLGVELDDLEVTDGTVCARATNRSISYWELMGGKRFDCPIELNVRSKTASKMLIIGQHTPARDINNIVTGAHAFVHDMMVDGMLHGRPIRPPHIHARLKDLDGTTVRAVRRNGIEVVRDGSFLAVAGTDEFAVIKAAQRLATAATWDASQNLDAHDIYQQLITNRRVSLPVVNGTPKDGPLPRVTTLPEDAKATHSATFEKPYIMHGSIGPSAAMAISKNGDLEIWTHSQGIYLLRAALAEAFSIPVERLRIHHRPGAGCYGHNGADDAAVDAAIVARALPGRAVLLKWTREDEHAWEPYGPAMVLQLSGAVDKNGTICAWSHETYSDTHVMRPRPGVPGLGPSRLMPVKFLANPPMEIDPEPNRAHHGGIHRNLEPLYRIEEPRLVKHLVRDLPLRTSALRTLGAYANVFALECFLDELAEVAEEDPIDLRRRHLDDPRAWACIEAVAHRIGNLDKAPQDCGRGLGFAQYKNTKAYAAVAVELMVDQTSRVHLHRAILAGDAGQVVDPVGLKAQLEGGFIQAASWTLYEEVAYDPNGITSRNWESYPIIGFDNIPEIETILLDRPGAPFLGAGEAVCGPTGAAIVNAVRRATGVSARRLPLTPDNLRRAALG